MAKREGFIRVGPHDGAVFADSRSGDVLFYTSTSNQRILLGARCNQVAEVAVSAASGVSVSRRLGVAGLLSVSGNGPDEEEIYTAEGVSQSFWNRNASNDLYYFDGKVAVAKSNCDATLDVAGTIAAERYVGAGSNPIVVGTSIVPLSNSLYDLGTSNMRFRDLFVSSGTIHIGEKTLSSSNDELVTNAVISSTAGFKVGETPVVDSNGAVDPGRLPVASLSNAGIVILDETVSSSCNDRAATAGAVRLAYSNADSRLSVLGGTVSGNLAVTGNFTVSGTTLIVNTESLLVKDNLVVLNSSLSNGTPPANLVSGLEVSRGSLCNYQFLFSECNDTFRIGEVGALQAVATRPDTVADRSLAYWDSSSNWLAFDSNLRVSSAGDVALSGGNRYVGTTSFHNLALRTSNVDRITVSSNGNVGVGAINPQTALHLLGTPAFSSNYYTNALLRLQSVDPGANPFGFGGLELRMGGYNHIVGMDLNELQLRAKGDSIFGTIGFYTSNGNLSAMNITSSGNVGIGASNPQFTLDMRQKTDAITVPTGTHAQRPSSTTPGQLRFNNFYNSFETYNGVTWAGTQQSALPPNDNMMLFWDAGNLLSYPGTGTTLTSLVSPQINGTMTNVTYSSGALVFNGTNSYVDATLNNPAGAWVHSISFWFQISAAQSSITAQPFQIGSTATTSKYSALYIANNDFNWYFFGNDTKVTTNILNANTWYHIALTYNGGTADTTNKCMYLNAIQLPLTFSGTPGALNIDANAVMSLGRDRTRNQNYFPGRIANFQIFNRVLTPVEVTNMYHTMKPRFDVPMWCMPGSVMQIQTNVYTGAASYSGTTYADIDSTFGVTITPRFIDSKIMIQGMVHIGGSQSTDARFTFLRLARTTGGVTTEIGNGTTSTTGNVGSPCIAAHTWGGDGSSFTDYNIHIANVAITYIDTPNTTSATTYRFRWNPNPAGFGTRLCYINRTSGHVDNFRANTISTITATEIAQ